jgi:hypothetical protein
MKRRDMQGLLAASQNAAKVVYPQYRWEITQSPAADVVLISVTAPIRRADQSRTVYLNAPVPGQLLEEATDAVGVITVHIERAARGVEAEIRKMKDKGWVLDEMVTR